MIRKLLYSLRNYKLQTLQFSLQRNFSCGQTSQRNTSSSSRWLQRHLSDPYVKNAARDDYLCRSAYKLIELDKKFQFLKPGKVVIDCGASPGSWTQVAITKVLHSRKGSRNINEGGVVIAVDLLDIKKIPGAIILGRHDFTSQETQDKILSLLPSQEADIILSDMAPNSTGNHSLDHEAILELAESVHQFGCKVLTNNGTLVCKIWDGRGTQDFMKTLQKNFTRVKTHKPCASRKESAELYIYADGFKGE